MTTRLGDAIFWVAVACCAVAQLAIVRSSIVSPVQAPASGTSSTAGRRRVLEICWAVLPGIVLALLFIATWRAMHPAAIAPHVMSAR